MEIVFVTDPQSPLQPLLTEGVPGCGLAAYSMVLLSGFVVGFGGMLFSSLALLQAGDSDNGPSMLVPGTQVAVWRLQPMWDAKLLTVHEVPLAWHDETMTGRGEQACALSSSHVLRVDDGNGWAIPYAEIQDLRLEGKGTQKETVSIVASDGFTLPCHFRIGEGAEQLFRMIEAERP